MKIIFVNFYIWRKVLSKVVFLIFFFLVFYSGKKDRILK